jgi:hypothetical protein
MGPKGLTGFVNCGCVIFVTILSDLLHGFSKVLRAQVCVSLDHLRFLPSPERLKASVIYPAHGKLACKGVSQNMGPRDIAEVSTPAGGFKDRSD